MEGFEERHRRALGLLREAGRVCAFTGAGISTESGISDFRSPGGVWDRHRIVTYQEFLLSPSARREYWAMKRELFNELKAARPNRAHLALAGLQRMGKLGCLITQNIDGLHEDAGNSPEIIVELHGSNRRALCLKCGGTWPIGEIMERLDAGEEDPHCPCGGAIKPATVSFGQEMPQREMERAVRCASECDLFLMIGSSLLVEPAASIPPIAHKAGARLIFINRTDTPWDHIAEIIFREGAGDVLGGFYEGISI